MTRSDSLKELAAALANAQSQIEGAPRSSENPFFKSKYADLASVWDACRKQLTSNGLSVVQAPFASPEGIGITTLLLHVSGEWIESSLTAIGKDTGPQASGSVITYLRRYALSAMAGVPQIDDDAEAGEGRKLEAKPAPTRKPAPTTVIRPVVETSDKPVTITVVVEKPYTEHGESRVGHIITLSDGREARTTDAALANRAKSYMTTKFPLRVVTEVQGDKLFVVEFNAADELGM